MEHGEQYSVLSSMYEVCRFLLTEKDLPTLLQGICDRLVAGKSFSSSLVVLIDESTGGMITAETGLAGRRDGIMNLLRQGSLPECGARLLQSGESVIPLCSDSDCTFCDDIPHEHGYWGVCAAIRCTPSLYGFYIVYTRDETVSASVWNKELFRQVGESIGHALRQLFQLEKARQKEEEMHLVEERYELALYASQAGLWDWNIKTGEMYTSPNQTDHLDYRNGADGPGVAGRVIHPDDKDKVLTILNKHLAGETEEYRIEYRVKDDHDQWVWYLDRGRVVERDENNMPVRMTGTHQNISIQKQREQAISAIQQQLHDAVDHERNFLQTVIDSAGDPVMVIDLQYTILLINRTAAALIDSDISTGSMLKKKCYELFCGASEPCTAAEFPCPIKEIQQHGRRMKLIHNPYHGNGINNTFELEVSPLRHNNGELYGIIEVARDVTDRLRIEEELRDSQSRLYRLAHYDTLTGLPNRLLFRDRLNQALAKSGRLQKSVALMYLDLDKFKRINDTLGHDVGDLLLVEVAHRFQQQCRVSDTVARIGGDEFVFILDGITSKKDVATVAQKVISAMARPMMLKGHELLVSTSIGIALYPDDSKEMDTVIMRADQALYQAKKSGRSTFCFYAPSHESTVPPEYKRARQ